MRAVLERPSVETHNRIHQILEDLRKAETNQAMRERRSADRTHFVRPVVITLGRNKQTEILATSKDLSRTDICLIHDVELQTGRIGVLTIHRLNEDPVQIRADVRWCQSFCRSWFISGWRFIVEERN